MPSPASSQYALSREARTRNEFIRCTKKSNRNAALRYGGDSIRGARFDRLRTIHDPGRERLWVFSPKVGSSILASPLEDSASEADGKFLRGPLVAALVQLLS
jgi:hypothetical protein